ncbi:hypothetical protein WCLP8_4190001 [uncultured Gammaproteobacteria bacterium]
MVALPWLRQTLLKLARRMIWLRRLQPRFDQRDRRLRPLLERARHAPPLALVEAIAKGGVVFGIASLGPGGAERQMVTMIAGLAAAGVTNATLLVEDLSSSEAQRFHLATAQQTGIPIREVRRLPINPDADSAPPPGTAEHTVRQLGVFPSWFEPVILAIYHDLAEIRPAVVYTYLDWGGMSFGVAAVLAGVPRVIISTRSLSPLDHDLFQWYMVPVYRSLLALPGVTVVNNSAAGARDYARWLNLPPASIPVVYNGLDLKRFVPPDDERRRAARLACAVPATVPVVGVIFRFSAEKRPFLWLRVAARVMRQVPEVHFLLCGDGPLQPQAQALARRLGLAKRVTFSGETAHPELAYAAMDLFLLTSRLEGVPNVVLEAQAVNAQ